MSLIDMEKKRIYSGKKYYSGPNKWSYSYKYEGQKSFWARTDVSPKEYEKLMIESDIELEASRLKIKFKDKDYDNPSLRKLYDDLCKEENHIDDENDANKSIRNKASSWKSRQRRLRKEGKLDFIKVSKLNSHGMTWNPLEDLWEQNFLRFRKYGLNTDNEEWVKEQRTLFKKSKLNNENLTRLKSADFPFNEQDGEIFEMTKRTIWALIEKLEKKQKAFWYRQRKK